MKRTSDAADWWTGRIGKREGLFPRYVISTAGLRIGTMLTTNSNYLDISQSQDIVSNGPKEPKWSTDSELFKTPETDLSFQTAPDNFNESPPPSDVETDQTNTKFQVLRSSSSNIRKFAGSMVPEMKYQSDFRYLAANLAGGELKDTGIESDKLTRKRQRDREVESDKLEKERQWDREEEWEGSTAVGFGTPH